MDDTVSRDDSHDFGMPRDDDQSTLTEDDRSESSSLTIEVSSSSSSSSSSSQGAPGIPCEFSGESKPVT